MIEETVIPKLENTQSPNLSHRMRATFQMKKWRIERSSSIETGDENIYL